MPELVLPPGVLALLRSDLSSAAARAIAVVTTEVAEYGEGLDVRTREALQDAVRAALDGFLRVAARSTDSSPLAPARDGAYALGRGEARSGRTVDALLTAYRVGARATWRDWADLAASQGLEAHAVGQFAELVFTYIEQLSAASLAGHSDELARSGRLRQRDLERLGRALVTDGSPETLQAAATTAGWTPPEQLTAVLVPAARTRATLAQLDPQTLLVPGDVIGLHDTDAMLAAGTRARLLARLRGHPAVVGPTRPWLVAGASFDRAVRVLSQHSQQFPTGLVDTEDHLPALVLTADTDALADLRAAALLPLSELRAETADRLAETLRAWLLRQGRREQVAEDLHVHPQTVRYRMTQLRELFGDRLDDPEQVLRLILALAQTPVTAAR